MYCLHRITFILNSLGEAGRVEAYAVADVKLYDAQNQKVGLTEPATIRIPVSNRFDSVAVGDQVPAWYFNEAIGEFHQRWRDLIPIKRAILRGRLSSSD